MNFIPQPIEGLILIRPSVYKDHRGSFRRNFCVHELREAGVEFTVCQGNISENTHAHTLRGFHYQRSPSTEQKILTPISGGLYMVAVDLRPTSATFLQSFGLEIFAATHESVHVPAGCAVAFLTLQPNTFVQYYMGDYFKPESYSGFRYNDPYFSIKWPHTPAVISDRDTSFPDFLLDQL